MAEQDVQFRLCLSPNCGLRYPLVQGSPFGERCPICMGATRMVAERRLEDEHVAAPPHQSLGIRISGLIDNVRSAWNVGSIFRTAEGYGIQHLYLAGISPTPDQRHLRKTALGADIAVEWSTHRNAVQLTRNLKAAGSQIWALEHTATSRPLEMATFASQRMAEHVLVVGNERAGIDPGVLELADESVHLEMHGKKRSFNVAVAFAIAAHIMSGATYATEGEPTRPTMLR